MADTLTAQIKASLHWLFQESLDLATIADDAKLEYDKTLADGTGADQADKVWHDSRTLAAAASDDLDLNALANTIFGSTVTINFAKAKSILIAARGESFLDAHSRIETTSSWAQLAKMPGKIDKPINVLFNATYLFSSASLDVDDVSETVMAIKQSPRVRRVLLVYSNTTTEISGEKFRAFKKDLKAEFTTDGLKRCEREYHKRRSSIPTSKIEFVRQILKFKDDE